MSEWRRTLASAALATMWALGMPMVALAAVGRATTDAPQGSGSPDAWDHVSLEVTLEHWVVTTDGQPKGNPAEPLRYRWERSRKGRTWQNTIVWLSFPGPSVGEGDARQTLPSAFLPPRLELTDDGSEMRLVDQAGREIPLPFDAARRAIETAWVPELPDLRLPDSSIPGEPAGSPRGEFGLLVASRSGAGERHERLRARLGDPVGTVQGLDRYLDRRGSVTVEVLVDPELSIPLDISTIRDGVLQARTVRSVEAGADQLTTRRVRTEQLLAGPDGDRSITEIRFGRPVFEVRGGVE